MRPSSSWPLAAPLPAVALGVVVMRAHGISASRWLVNIVATGVGLGLCVMLRRIGGSRLSRPGTVLGLSLGAVLFLLCTFACPDSEGVHRWVALGPLQVHVGSLVLPFVVLGAVFLPARPSPRHLLVLAAMGALALQPDAGQALALTAAILACAMIGVSGVVVRIAAAIAVGLAILAWRRPDPLLAVDHVERIVHLAWQASWRLGVLSIASLLLLPVPFAVASWRHRGKSNTGARLGAGLAAYVTCSILVTEVGNFPVPVMGYGASPILGMYAALGLIEAFKTRPRV